MLAILTTKEVNLKLASARVHFHRICKNAVEEYKITLSAEEEMKGASSGGHLELPYLLQMMCTMSFWEVKGSSCWEVSIFHVVLSN